MPLEHLFRASKGFQEAQEALFESVKGVSPLNLKRPADDAAARAGAELSPGSARLHGRGL